MGAGKPRRVVYWVAAAIVALAVGAGSFFGVRTLTGDGGSATADRKPLPSDWDRYFNEDAARPRFNQEISGILVGPDTGVEPTSGLCGEKAAEPQYAPVERAVGTMLDINPAYLPEGVELSPSVTAVEVVECGGTVISVVKYYHVPDKFSGKDQTGDLLWSGGEFSIWRMLSTRHAFPLDGAADRIGPISVKGRPGVLMRPVMPGGADVGVGNAAIVIAEDFGLTVIQGSGLPLGEFVKIVEGLY